MAANADETDPRVLVVVPGGEAEPLAGLASELSLERREALAGTLLSRTVDWASGLAGGDAEIVEAGSVREAAKGAQSVVLVRPALVRLGSAHAEDLLGDLRAGCGVVVGPTLAGGWYLLALKPVDDRLLEAAGGGGPGSAGALVACARDHDPVEVGLLRAERDLTGTADLLAARADPLLDIEITGLLG